MLPRCFAGKKRKAPQEPQPGSDLADWRRQVDLLAETAAMTSETLNELTRDVTRALKKVDTMAKTLAGLAVALDRDMKKSQL